MIEVWKDVVGYEGLYQVSNLGNVKSLKRIKSNNQPTKEKVMKKYIGKGYYRVALYLDGKMKNKSVSRLVAQAFIPNPENKPCINHINGIKNNNQLYNLEWCTILENSQHAYNTGLTTKTPLNFVHTSKEVAQLDKDGNIIKVYPSSKEASRVTGINHSSINTCARGIRVDKRRINKTINVNTAGGYKWKYTEDLTINGKSNN